MLSLAKGLPSSDDRPLPPFLPPLTHTITERVNCGETAVERGEAVTSQAQPAGLMMNKKERRTHKGDEGEKRLLKHEGVTKKIAGERPFFTPRGWMEWYCKSGLLGFELYRQTHTLVSHINVHEYKFKWTR